MAGTAAANFLSGLLGGSSMGSTLVGLNISTSSVKLIELKKAGKGWKLLHFGMVQLPEDAVVGREILNTVAVVEAIKTIAASVKLKNKNVCTSLSGSSQMFKRMSVDVPNPKELEEQVFWVAEQYLPFDVSEVVMDFQLLNNPKDKVADVLLVACKKSALESYMGCVQDAGLKPQIVDMDLFSLQNAFEANYTPVGGEAVAIVDVGADATKILVVQDGVPTFTKDASIGGRGLTAEIQKHLNIGFQDAEGLKQAGVGQGMPQEVSELMHVTAENIAQEIKKAMDLYNASSVGAPINYILLTGGSSKIPDLARIIEESTQRPTQMMNPFNSITYDPKVFTPTDIENIAPFAAVPIGLAIRAQEGIK